MSATNANSAPKTSSNEDLVKRLKAQALVLGWKVSEFFMPGFGRIEFRADERIATACVQLNGIIRFSPKFAASLTDAEIRFVIAHEITHLLMLHHDRRGARKPQKWNISTDLLINYNLKQIENKLQGNTSQDIFRMPKVGIIADDKQADMTAEEIYNSLDDDAYGGGSGDYDPDQVTVGAGCGVQDDDGNGQGMTREEKERALREWHEAAVQSQMMGRKAGDFAGNLLANLLTIPEPRIRWADVLRGALNRALQAAGHDDVTWQRRSRRSNLVFILPGGVTYKCRAAVVIDTSGSMSDDDLTHAVAETVGIVNHTNVPVFLVVHDHGVQEACWIRPGSKGTMAKFVSSKMKGRGGTSFDEAYARVQEEPGKFNVMVHLTDGEIYGTWPAKPANTTKMVVALLGSKNHSDVPALAKVIDVEIS